MPDWPTESEAVSYYGNPEGENGQASPTWEQQNLIYVKTPWRLVTSWSFQEMSSGIRIHSKCASSLSAIFDEIWEAAGKSQKQIDEWGMNLCGGGFTFRIKRGSNELSMHAFGCAVDFDPQRNERGNHNPHFGNIPEVLDAFARQKWVWGGTFSIPDGMHWQAAK